MATENTPSADLDLEALIESATTARADLEAASAAALEAFDAVIEAITGDGEPADKSGSDAGRNEARRRFGDK